MLAGETTCRVPSDTAGYWAPTAFMDGVQVKPGVMRIYYLGPAFGTVETIPAGLQMVGGNKEAQSPAENPHVSWSCGQTKSVKTPREDTPYDCTPWASYGFVDGIVAADRLPQLLERHRAPARGRDVPVRWLMPGRVRAHHPQAERTRALRRDEPDRRRTGRSRSSSRAAPGTPCTPTSGTPGSRSVSISSSRTAWSRRRTAARSTPRARSRWDAAVRHAALRPRVRGRARRRRRVVRRRLHELRARGSDVPPPLRRVPEPVRRRRRRGVDQAVRHERDRSGARDRGLGDRRVRRGFDRRALPQAEARGGTDGFVARFEADGTRVWLQQFGTKRDDEVAAIAATRGSVYLAGASYGRLSKQQLERGVRRVRRCGSTPTGREAWTRQFGGAGEDSARAVSVLGVEWSTSRARHEGLRERVGRPRMASSPRSIRRGVAEMGVPVRP